MNNPNPKPTTNEFFDAALSRLLFALALSGLMTVPQLAQFVIKEFDDEIFEAALEFCIRRKLIAPVRINEKDLVTQLIVKFTEHGKKYYRKINKSAARRAIGGKLTASQIANARRTLLKAESLVLLNGALDIRGVVEGSQLNKTRTLDYLDECGVSIDVNDSQYQQSDYLVLGYYRHNGEYLTASCRLGDGLTWQTIESSEPQNWFVTNKRRYRELKTRGYNCFFIEPFKPNRYSEIVEFADALFAEGRVRAPASGLNEMDQFVLQRLQNFGIMLCHNDLMIFCRKLSADKKKLQSKLQYSLQKLSKLGLVKAITAKIRPGYHVGRATAYYFIPKNEKFLIGKCFQRQVILSYFLRKEWGKRSFRVKFDPAFPSIQITAGNETTIFISDYTDGERNSDVSLTVKNFNDFSGNQKCPVKLVVVDYPRYFKLADKIGKDRLVNLCDDFEEYCAW